MLQYYNELIRCPRNPNVYLSFMRMLWYIYLHYYTYKGAGSGSRVHPFGAPLTVLKCTTVWNRTCNFVKLGVFNIYKRVQFFSPTLNDEFVENSMESGAGVRVTVDAVRQNRNEIGHRFRGDFSKKTDFDPSQPVAGHCHVEVRHVGDRERLNTLYIHAENSRIQRAHIF